MRTVQAGIGLLALAAVAWLPAAPSAAADMVAITDRGEFFLFTDTLPQGGARRELIGAGGTLVGIDVRPADGQLYGVTSEGAIVLINPYTGVASFRAVVGVPLDRASAYVVDFNPVADRLRIVGSTGQNLRVNVDTGETAVDGRLPQGARVSAGAYSNSVRGATATRLYVFDAAAGAYALQNPPNDGRLQPILAAPGLVVAAADIASDGTRDVGYASTDNMLLKFDPATGHMRAAGAISLRTGALMGRVIDIAVLPPRN